MEDETRAEERTQIAVEALLVGERTQVAIGSPEATQAVIAVTCPVCRTENRPGERWCADCGFLLGSEVGEAPEVSETVPAAWLIAEDGREYALAVGVNTVGRENADVLLLDPTVSRRHARLTLEAGQLWVEDEGSTNGTCVGEEWVRPGERRAVRDGDRVRFGGVSLTVALSEGLAAEAGGGGVETTPPELRRAIAFLIADDGTEYPLWEGRTAVGRRSDNDLVLSGDPYLSGRHAEFICDAKGCSVMDVGSTNGTFLRGDRLPPHQPRPLTPGDELRLGQSVFIFQAAAASETEGEPTVSPTIPGEDEAAAGRDDEER